MRSIFSHPPRASIATDFIHILIGKILLEFVLIVLDPEKILYCVSPMISSD